MTANKPGSVNQRPLYGCTNCYEDWTWTAGDLRVHDGECWCDLCWDERRWEFPDLPYWSQLEPYAPAGQQPDVAKLVEALTELCDEIDKHEIHAAISATSISWFKRKAREALAALQSQDAEDAAQAEWMVDDGRAPWAINSLKDRIKEMRASEKRCRNAFRKDYMRVVSVYFADALGEAAEALEKRLSVIDHARRAEGDASGH